MGCNSEEMTEKLCLEYIGNYNPTQFSCVVEYANCTKKDILKGNKEAKRRKVKQFINNPIVSTGYIWKLYKFLGIKRFTKDLLRKIIFIFSPYG